MVLTRRPLLLKAGYILRQSNLYVLICKFESVFVKVCGGLINIGLLPAVFTYINSV